MVHMMQYLMQKHAWAGLDELPHACAFHSCCRSASCASHVASSAPAGSRMEPLTQQRMP